MIETLVSLPYVHYWLPALAAVVLGLPLYLLAMRTGRLVPVPEAAPEPLPVQSDPFATGSTSEQRTAFRRTGNPIEILFTRGQTPAANPERGFVLDRSVGGLRLMITCEVAAGSVLSVRPQNVSPMVPWVQVEVRSCVRSSTQSGEYDVGCRFVKSPPYPVLLLFG
jgi:hypothetical protein